MISAADQPIPPRFWWLKRITVASVVLIIALAGLRWWWGHEAHRRLQAEIDRIVAAGEPIYPEDFDSKNTVPDDQNAVTALKDGAASLATNPRTPEWMIVLMGSDGLCREDNKRAIAELLIQNGTALQRLRDARLRDAVDWNVKFRSPTIDQMFPEIYTIRALPQLGAAGAFYQHSRGIDGEAFDLLLDVFRAGELLHHHPTISTQMAGDSCDLLALSVLEKILFALAVSLEGESRAGDLGSVRRTKLIELIASLLDESLIKSGFKRAIRAEGMMEFDTFREMNRADSNFFRSSGLSTHIEEFVAFPLYALDTGKLIQITQQQCALIDMENWKTIRDFNADLVSRVNSDSKILHRFLMTLSFSWDSVQRSHLHTRAVRKMAATAIAIRLYQLDHNGQRPKELSDLMPQYLPSSPLDPFGNGETLGYRPDANPPYLYSIYEDAVDQGGEYKFVESGHVDRKSLDLPFFLAPNAEQERLICEYEAKRAEEESKMQEAKSHQTGKHGPNENR